MDERLKCVARLLDGEKMAGRCREFDIARKTGYKIFNRYRDCGLRGLTDRSRRPYRQANQLPFQVEKRFVQLKHEHPNWVVPSTRSGHAGSRLPRNGNGPLNLLFLATRWCVCRSASRIPMT